MYNGVSPTSLDRRQLDFDDAIQIAVRVVIGAVAEAVLQGVKALHVLSDMSARGAHTQSASSTFRGVQLGNGVGTGLETGTGLAREPWSGPAPVWKLAREPFKSSLAWKLARGLARGLVGSHGRSRHRLGNWRGDWLGRVDALATLLHKAFGAKTVVEAARASRGTPIRIREVAVFLVCTCCGDGDGLLGGGVVGIRGTCVSTSGPGSEHTFRRTL
jgi:hypothetical protein